MYKISDTMFQNLHKDLKRFHELFSGGRCQAWQLEELIAKAIRSDFSKSEKVIWSGNGHDVEADIIINDSHKIQVKSGTLKNGNLNISGHRLGRFDGNLLNISDFLNNRTEYSILSVPYERVENNKGITHKYCLYYIDTKIMYIKDANKWYKSGKSYVYNSDNGVIMKISPSMSWQIWWTIPVTLLDNSDNTRIIEIC